MENFVKSFLIIFAFFVSLTNSEKYEGAQEWRVHNFDNPNIKSLIKYLQKDRIISIWLKSQDYVDISVEKPFLKFVHKLFNSTNISFEILTENLQRDIERENPPERRIANARKKTGHSLTWIAYHPLPDVYEYLEYIAETYPEICKVMSIGESFEDRDIKLIKISNGRPKNKAIWIDGGIHAREWISVAVVTYIINELTVKRQKHSEYMKNIDWYIVPVLNPDGYSHTHSHPNNRLWRKNRSTNKKSDCLGVDLNRNFGFKWGDKGTSNNPCHSTYKGSKAFSEPESQLVRNFFESSSAHFEGFLSFHSYGQYILIPWAYQVDKIQDYNDLMKVGSNAAKKIMQHTSKSYTVGTAPALLYSASGGSLDWAKGAQNIKYSFVMELRDKKTFILPADQIIPAAHEAMILVKEVAKAIS